MPRTLISSAMPDRLAHVHGDESQGEPYSPEEEAFIVHRADELLAERLTDRALFRDLMSGIDLDDIYGPLQRMFANQDRAEKGESAGLYGLFAALTVIRNRRDDEARIVWADECRAEAEKQLREETP
mgnify:CR=1 FL=1